LVYIAWSNIRDRKAGYKSSRASYLLSANTVNRQTFYQTRGELMLSITGVWFAHE